MLDLLSLRLSYNRANAERARSGALLRERERQPNRSFFLVLLARRNLRKQLYGLQCHDESRERKNCSICTVPSDSAAINPRILREPSALVRKASVSADAGEIAFACRHGFERGSEAKRHEIAMHRRAGGCGNIRRASTATFPQRAPRRRAMESQRTATRCVRRCTRRCAERCKRLRAPRAGRAGAAQNDGCPET